MARTSVTGPELRGERHERSAAAASVALAAGAMRGCSPIAQRSEIKRVADEVRHEDRAILEEPEVWGVQSLGPGAITIRPVAKTKPLEQLRISRLLRERIKAEFDREGIEGAAGMPWSPEGQPSGVSAGSSPA